MKRIDRRIIAACALGGFTALVGACGSSSSNSGANWSITGKTMALAVRSSTISTLHAAGVSISPDGAASVAKTAGTTRITFPITGGTLSKSALEGAIDSEGGIKFTDAAGKSAVFMNPSINTANGILSATYNGNHIELLTLSSVSLAKSGSTNEVVARGIAATLPATTSVTIDNHLAATAFTPGQALGVIALDVTYQ